jgi:DNA polymerase III delta prime subunit
MQTQLRTLLDRFLVGASIQPILVDDSTACEIIRTLTKVAIMHLDELSTEYVSGVFCFETLEKSFKIETVRDIIEKASIRPSGEYQILVIRDIEKLTLAAGNALLKTLEDVPERTLFILTTKTKENLLETIRSRVLVFGENEEVFHLPEALKKAVENYFYGEKKNLLSLLYSEKYERSEYVALVLELIDYSKQGKIKDTKTLKYLESALLDLTSTNANARWIIDRIMFSL